MIRPERFTTAQVARVLGVSRQAARKLLEERIERGPKFRRVELQVAGLLEAPLTPEEAYEEREHHDALHQALLSLPAAEHKAFRRILLGEDGGDIAFALGVSGPRVTQITQSGWRRLRHPSRRRFFCR